MNSDELLSYINNYLENVEDGQERETFGLIELLKEKIDKKDKLIFETGTGNHTRRRRDFESRRSESNKIILQLSEKTKSSFAVLSSRKDALERETIRDGEVRKNLEHIKNKSESLFHELWKSFNKLNKLNLSMKQFLEILLESELISAEIAAIPLIEKDKKIYFLCEEETLLNINIVVVYDSSINSYENRKANLAFGIEEFLHFNKNFKSKPKFPRKNYFWLENYFFEDRNRLQCLSENLNEFIDKIILLEETKNNQFVAEDTLMEIENLPWKVLPPGEKRLELTINHFNKLKSNSYWSKKSFDENRLEIIERFLKPSKCYLGFDGFEGYVIYCFKDTKKVVLECPIYANAIYVINDGWQEIAKHSKWEIRNDYSSQVTTINHTDTWFERLKENLEKKY